MADIEAMFYQVRVPEAQRDLLRFMWWPNGDITQDLQEYQMYVHLFGVVSSPSLRRFVGRRGPVREIHSDQGTNLIGAENELKLAVKEMDSDKIQSYLKRNANADWMITWKRNPPAASHMGGVWERQIRTVRSTLAGIMHEHSGMLDDESFRSLLVEVESIVNSRQYLRFNVLIREDAKG